MKFQIIFFTIGFLFLIIGTSLIFPFILDYLDGHRNVNAFGWSALGSLFTGIALVLSNRGFDGVLSIRHAFVLTVTSWVVVSLICAIPLYVSDLGISFTDAFFESISGVTTTGSTILSGLDDISRGVHLWRAITQWIGGVGIIAFAMILLPFLRIGGMQLFKSESSDQSEKIMPKTNDIVISIVYAYVGLTVLCGITYWVLGMTPFEAVMHAMTTIPTGGYSNHDASFGYFESYGLHMAGTFFMFCGGIPFVLFVKLMYQGRWDFWRDYQVRLYCYLSAAVIGVLTLHMWWGDHFSLADSFKYAAFNTVSTMTTTGYATTDYSVISPFVTTVFFFVTYLGACAGSTAGGVKMLRINIAVQALNRYFKTLVYPRGVFAVHYQGKTVGEDVINAVMGFLFMYVAFNILIAVLLALTGLDFITSVTGAATAIANVGPGLGDIIGPAGNFSSLSDTAKWILCFGMLLGRLEIMTVIVLFIPSFWRD